MRDALQKVFYTKVTILPIIWGSLNPARRGRLQQIKNHNKWNRTTCEVIRSELFTFKEELSGLGDAFREFNFSVKPIFEIPDNDNDENCQTQLRRKITHLVLEHEDPRSLLIIIYGGHGVDTTAPDTEFFEKDHEGHSV
jgi:hypothetical protein